MRLGPGLDREAQRQQSQLAKRSQEVDLELGNQTDLFGHSYFTTNPQVSSDPIQFIRYSRRLEEPGRQLVKTDRATRIFPVNRDI